MPCSSVLNGRDEGIAVCTSYIGRITFSCAHLDLVKCTVVFRLTVICTAYNGAFDTSVFAVVFHNLVILLGFDLYAIIVSSFCEKDSRKIQGNFKFVYCFL